MTVALDTPPVARYLEETVRTWLGVRAPAPVPTLPPELARLFLRVEEHEQEHRDQWGCWEYAFNESYRRGALWEPEVDQWLDEQRAELAATTELEPLWPESRPFAISLTHDVDMMSDRWTPGQALRAMRTAVAPPQARFGPLRVIRPLGRLVRVLMAGVRPAPETAMLERSVALEQEHGVTASYFFTVYPRRPSRFDCVYLPSDRCTFRGRRMRVADVLRTLAEEGFDVGLHGSYNSAREPGRLHAERAVLEEATGLDVRTTRQHFLHWDIRVTPRLQADAGITADATVGFNRNLGFRYGTALPFRQFDLASGEALDLLEVPLVVHDGPLLRADGLELDLKLAREAVRTILDRVAATGGVAMFLIHPNNLARDEYVELTRFVLEYGRDAGAWFASLRDVDRWWRERTARLVAP